MWLSAEVVTGLWVLWLLTMTYGAWLLAVRCAAAPCSGLLCKIVTLDAHPTLALLLAECSAATLVVIMPVNSGPATASGLRFAGIVAAAVCGAIALAGMAALLLGAALVLIAAAAVVLYVIDNC